MVRPGSRQYAAQIAEGDVVLIEMEAPALLELAREYGCPEISYHMRPNSGTWVLFKSDRDRMNYMADARKKILERNIGEAAQAIVADNRAPATRKRRKREG